MTQSKRRMPIDRQKIKRLREQLRLSMEDASAKAGLTGRQHWHQIESGRSDDVRISTLEKIARARRQGEGSAEMKSSGWWRLCRPGKGLSESSCHFARFGVGEKIAVTRRSVRDTRGDADS
jgi:transcriptional regulator with XRE-family HTH domain